MKIGIVAATILEIQPTIDFLKQHQYSGVTEFEIVITGVGCIATAYRVLRFVHKHKPVRLIQAGIGGTFTKKFPPGEVAIIQEEIMGDLGAEEENIFTDIFDMGLMESSTIPFTNKRLANPHMSEYKKYQVAAANGITVNEITTQTKRIRLLHEKYNCEIESMEGAAFHYVCLEEKIEFMQLRAVSNYIGERDKSKWKLPQAVINLNDRLINIIQRSV